MLGHSTSLYVWLTHSHVVPGALSCTFLPQGVFIPAQVAAAAALLGRGSNLSSVLCAFFREDLLAWTSRKGKGGGGSSSSSGGLYLPSDTLKGLISKNTQQVREGRPGANTVRCAQ